MALVSHVGRLLMLLVCLGALLVRVPLGSLEFGLERACANHGCCCSAPASELSCCSGEAAGPIWVDACGCGGPEQHFDVYLTYDWCGEAQLACGGAGGVEHSTEIFEASADGRFPGPDPPIPRCARARC